MRRQLLLVRGVRVLDLVADAVPAQRDAGVVPAVRDGGDHRAAAGPARGEAEEGGAGGAAPRGLRARDRDGRARVVGRASVRRGAVQEEALGRHVRRIVQKAFMLG